MSFDSAAVTVAHDDNGNLIFDGLFNYRYDILNRLVEVAYGADERGDTVTMARYEYDGMNRRVSKTITNFGTGVVAGSDESGTISGIEAGNRVEHYSHGWDGRLARQLAGDRGA